MINTKYGHFIQVKTKFAKFLVYNTTHDIYLNILTSPQKDFMKGATGNKIKYHNILDLRSQYWYCSIFVQMTVGTFIKYKHNDICLGACLSQTSKTCGDISLDELCYWFDVCGSFGKSWCHITLCAKLRCFYHPADNHQIWSEHTYRLLIK